MSDDRFDATQVLSGLKDFQRRTVDHVFRRLYLDERPVRRFLVADEVGLGKTLVARGVIAKALEHLQDKVKRIDVVYVCSNAAIAAQNVARLNVGGHRAFNQSTRLTLLPTQVKHLKRNPVNFISLTPGTSFAAHSRGGIGYERAVLYQILEHPELGLDRNALLNLLQMSIGRERWKELARGEAIPIDPDIAADCRKLLRGDAKLWRDLRDGLARFTRYRPEVPDPDSTLRRQLVGLLRHALAKTCIAALDPDLVILDEFQRFRDLLDGDDAAASLARALFDYPKVRVLLLSATPYKMLTFDHEAEDDHYTGFLRTLGFLFGDDAEVGATEAEIRAYRKALYALADGDYTSVGPSRAALEHRLRAVMCRTERVAMSKEHGAMLSEPDCTALLDPGDLHHAATTDGLARAVGAGDAIEYWKSCPYFANFARDYDFRRKLEKVRRRPGDRLVELLERTNGTLLHHRTFNRYQPIDPGNARLRSLQADTIDRGLWRLLWMPPSLPYMRPQGAYAEAGDVTKALVFSAWNVVPDAIAALLSYEAERLMLGKRAKQLRHHLLSKQIKPLLKLSRSRGRLTGMPVVLLMYPSPALARLVDPLRLAMQHGGGDPLEPEELLLRAKDAIAEALAPHLRAAPTDGAVDERWYWAAPALLDREPGRLRRWVHGETGWRAAVAAPDDEAHESGLAEHLEELHQVLADRHTPLGRPPADLLDVLAQVAIASPGVCALRALSRIAPELELNSRPLLNAAARVAAAFRTMFNVPETIALLRSALTATPSDPEASYWRLVLSHALEGNLQAVLDEQVHTLRESLGVQDRKPADRIEDVASALSQALSIRTAQLHVQQIRINPDDRTVEIEPFPTRCRFALRFGDLTDEGGVTGEERSGIDRVETVRLAFNSPFRPFVLASTSIGQEGLDFHNWSHVVVHWNLPANPVDLEQREGRVHRYKGHAVRKNVASRHGLRALAGWTGTGDPWDHLFACAARDSRAASSSELAPYWLYDIDGGARIERRVPLLPFSREVDRLKRLKRGLALYRLVFGQPRQQDLLAHLQGRLSPAAAERAAAEWRISLAPPP